jgi:alkylated DNA repair protein alkB family protein 1
LTSLTPQLGLKPPSEWKAYNIKKCQGLIIIKNPFTSLAQRYWIRRLLKDYTKENKNNLLPARFSQSMISDFWKSYTEEVDEKQKRLLKKSFRWSTLGYNYDWNNKVYNEDDQREFPPELHNLIGIIAKVLGIEDYKSQAAIINFYPVGSTLAAHTDHSEICNSPLISLSFGQPAIFLIGGKTREEVPLPILLESGDVLIMSEESRFLFHAVPRVFKSQQCSSSWNADQSSTYCNDLDPKILDECRNEKWKEFNDYIDDSRINVNVRQFKK